MNLKGGLQCDHALSRNIWSAAIICPGRTKKRAIFSPGSSQTVRQPRGCFSGFSMALVEQAVSFLTDGSYPADANDNSKRSIRRKASQLVLRGGEVYIKKKKKVA